MSLKYPPGRIENPGAGKVKMTDDQVQKPDQWGCSCRHVNQAYGHLPPCKLANEQGDSPKPDAKPSSFSMDRHIELINAYEDSLASNRALKARVAELAKENIDEMRAHSDECDMHSETNRVLAEALAAARARIAELEKTQEPYFSGRVVVPQLRDELAKANERIADLEKALIGLKRGECWCDVGIGHPLMTKHSASCTLAGEAVTAVKDE